MPTRPNAYNIPIHALYIILPKFRLPIVMNRKALLALIFVLITHISIAQQKDFSVIAYYAGPVARLDSFPIGKLTHLIFSFGHLNGNRLQIDNEGDSACIRKMVSYKQRYPKLKIILSLGGWGACEHCSGVFASEKGRDEFARSVKQLNEYFHTDGIDLDWEYPAIAGFPGHTYSPNDRDNFTALVQKLRAVLGNKYEISFAAGGFDQFIDQSIDWKKVMPIANRVNVMTYDLTHGASDTSGHHTPLYSTLSQKQSTDNAVRALLAKGVPASKIVIGAAFYGRLFVIKSNEVKNNGLYEPTKFSHGFSYARMCDTISAANGFTKYWDDVAKAPYAYNSRRKLLATYDDDRSMRLKTQYAIQHKLGGIMFWQLADDRTENGLLDIIDIARRKRK